MGEGSFTLAHEKALEKLAAFTLPHESDWVLKVVQAAVASGVRSTINVQIERSETRMTFACSEYWSLDKIEGAFYQPESSGDQGLDHLKIALWATGIDGRRAFRILLPEHREMLVWNGVRLRRLPRDRKVPRFEFAVTPLGVGAVKASWLGRYMLTSERNADILKTLTQRCAACPTPVVVDGRQVCGLDKLHMPSGTHIQVCSLKLEDFLTMVVGGVHKHQLLSKKPGWSSLRWLKDGVIISTECLTQIASPLAVTLLVDSQSLATDLTGFELQDNEAKRHRAQSALAQAKESLTFMIGSLDISQVEVPCNFIDYWGLAGRVEYWKARLPAKFDQFALAFQEVNVLGNGGASFSE